MRTIAVLAAAAALGVSLSSKSLHAQCPIPDLLDSAPCCAPVALQVPDFNPFISPAAYLCFSRCNLEQNIQLSVDWGQIDPVRPAGQTVCGLYKALVRVRNAQAHVLYSGPMTLHYSRTWFEADGVTREQVWRFLVNGDLQPTDQAGPAPCPTPDCIGIEPKFPTFHVWGYYDVALDCLTGTFHFSGALNHDCDRVHHARGFLRQGNFHPERSYTIVWPRENFVPSPTLPIEQGLFDDEAIRLLDLFNRTCLAEEPASGNALAIKSYCPCPNSSGVPPQYTNLELQAFGVCGSIVRPPGTGSPFFNYNTKAIGFWAGLPHYPNSQALRVTFGKYNFTNACTGATTTELFYGVCTLRHKDAFRITLAGIGGRLGATFLDQGNARARINPPPGPVVANIPYISNIILNFNLP